MAPDVHGVKICNRSRDPKTSRWWSSRTRSSWRSSDARRLLMSRLRHDPARDPCISLPHRRNQPFDHVSRAILTIVQGFCLERLSDGERRAHAVEHNAISRGSLEQPPSAPILLACVGVQPARPVRAASGGRPLRETAFAYHGAGRGARRLGEPDASKAWRGFRSAPVQRACGRRCVALPVPASRGHAGVFRQPLKRTKVDILGNHEVSPRVHFT